MFHVCHHSEELTIAFGLISTPPAIPIRIIKNLQVCVDCPTSTKFSAKIVRTAITVRDASFWTVFAPAVMICEVWGVTAAQSEDSWGIWWIDINLIIDHFTLLLGTKLCETIDTNCLSLALCGKGPWTPGCSQEAIFPLLVSWTAPPPTRHLPLQAQWI